MTDYTCPECDQVLQNTAKEGMYFCPDHGQIPARELEAYTANRIGVTETDGYVRLRSPDDGVAVFTPDEARTLLNRIEAAIESAESGGDSA